ncbi:MAG: succinate--CoA ligase subunit beta [Thermoanaerobacteraceae bacterium]|nr:succinate--CoA ligase subunit beta [Thermoanaerobacteraceae bacterium]
MARLLEDLSKNLFKQSGIPVPQNIVITGAGEAEEAFARLNGAVVLKALVPVGKRGKAGAIKFARSAAEAREMAEQLFGMTVGFYRVEQVLMEEMLDIKEEYYLSITIDKANKTPVIIASTKGGMDVEEVNREHPELVGKLWVDPLLGLCDYQARELWSELGVTGRLLQKLGSVTSKLYRIFEGNDAYLLEINPLVLTLDDQVVAADAVMSVDDSALFRHPQLLAKVQMGTERAWRPLTELEKEAVAVNEADPYRGTARYTEMDGGDIGFMCGGGGGSLLLFDALRSQGGEPANYSEFGGNPPEDKVYGLTKVILSKPGVKGLFVAQNITNNTQVDVVARGVIRAVKDLNIDPAVFPIVVREAGVNEAEARELFSEAGIEYYGDEITLTEAARKMVEKMATAYRQEIASGKEGR